MGFLSGSTSFTRFRITDDPTGTFGEEHLQLLSKHKIKSTGRNLHEQPSIGFLGGAHVLDTKFDFDKNIIGDAMHFAIRIDSCQIPGQSWLILGVTDDGVGLGAKQALSLGNGNSSNPTRLGMLGMRERVELLHGQISVSNDAGSGTSIMIKIPIEEANA